MIKLAEDIFDEYEEMSKKSNEKSFPQDISWNWKESRRKNKENESMRKHVIEAYKDKVGKRKVTPIWKQSRGKQAKSQKTKKSKWGQSLFEGLM